MNALTLRITGRDPLLFRDGRPFGTELGALSARTLPFPLPGTLAGFLRTRLGDLLEKDWRNATSTDWAQAVEVAGPLLARREGGGAWQPLLPAPADALVVRPEGQDPQVMGLRPRAPGLPGGCDLPARLRPLAVEDGGKPLAGFRFWDWDDLLAWLRNPGGAGQPTPAPFPGLPLEERVHVGLDSSKGTAREGSLFTTQGLRLEGWREEAEPAAAEDFRERIWEEWSLLCRCSPGEAVSLDGLATLGGERRLAPLETVSPEDWPALPPELLEQTAEARLLRLLLATPAPFQEGWKPGWLDRDLEGSPPGAPGIRLRLVAAAVPRHQAVSGWDCQLRRPKAIRWLAPAGSVYFLELLEGEAPELLSRTWLHSLCEEEQARRDGYGLALWGVWSEKETNHAHQ